MDVEQCLEIMKQLARFYQQVADTKNISEEDIIRLKHVALELELAMISVRTQINRLGRR